MRVLRLISLLFAGLMLTACLPVTSKAPLGTTAPQTIDPALAGAWKGGTPDGKSPSYFHFLPAKDGNETTVVMVAANPGDEKEWMVFAVTPAKLGKYNYLNARITFQDGEANKVDARFPVLYTLKNDTLTIFLLEEKKTAEAIRQGRLSGNIEEGQFGNVTLTGTEKSLDAFFSTKEGAELFAEKMFVLRKMR